MSKLTLKQEGFCLSSIETGNASEAYRRNYDAKNMSEKVVHNKASDLLNKGEVRVRLTELQTAHQERHNITIDSLTLRLTAAENLGLANNNPSAAVAAIMGIAKLHGLLVDKVKSTITIEDQSLADRLKANREYRSKS